MNIIKDNIINEIKIKKSRFIGHIFLIKNTADIELILDDLKKEYKDSSHICYAYRLKNTEKCSDDGEPSGTAGLPILNILQKNNLINVLAVVVRYFGGVKLGTGGLIRAYQKSIKECLEKTTIIPYQDLMEIILVTDFDNQKLLNNLCQDYLIINKVFDEKINYTIRIDKKDYEELKDKIINTNIEIK